MTRYVQTGARTKITTPVDFGPTLTFKGLLIYDLIGIIIHDGDTDESGHYYAYLRLANGVGLGNSWFEVNDTVVRPVSDDEVDIICTGRHNLGVTAGIWSSSTISIQLIRPLAYLAVQITVLTSVPFFTERDACPFNDQLSDH